MKRLIIPTLFLLPLLLLTEVASAQVGVIRIPAPTPAEPTVGTIRIPSNQDTPPPQFRPPQTRPAPAPVPAPQPAPAYRPAPQPAPAPTYRPAPPQPAPVVAPTQTRPAPTIRPAPEAPARRPVPAPPIVEEAPDPLLEAPDPLLEEPEDPLLAGPPPNPLNIQRVKTKTPPLPSKAFDFGFWNRADKIEGMQIAGPLPFENYAASVSGLQMSIGYGKAENNAVEVNGVQAALGISGVNLIPLPYGINDTSFLNGAQIALGANSADGGGGLQLGLLKNFVGHQSGTDKPFGGVQIAINNQSKNTTFSGIQLGLVNTHMIDEFDMFNPRPIRDGTSIPAHYHGIQFGLANNAHEITGLQIGLLNNARRLHGIQIGLLNNTHDHDIKWLPLINAGF